MFWPTCPLPGFDCVRGPRAIRYCSRHSHIRAETTQNQTRICVAKKTAKSDWKCIKARARPCSRKATKTHKWMAAIYSPLGVHSRRISHAQHTVSAAVPLSTLRDDDDDYDATGYYSSYAHAHTVTSATGNHRCPTLTDDDEEPRENEPTACHNG